MFVETPALPKVEGMITNPKSPYAVSKLAGEYYCRVGEFGVLKSVREESLWCVKSAYRRKEISFTNDPDLLLNLGEVVLRILLQKRNFDPTQSLYTPNRKNQPNYIQQFKH
ncbi:MAG: hypothetical protein NQU46_04840 [Methanolinea sp.]|nr:hypothetical protein [Methanolinea sp.]